MNDIHTFNAPLSEVDPEIAEVLKLELGRQQDYLEMIASENFVPRSILQTQGSVLTNKYAEGYPGKRYYGGCEFVDIAESLAIERAVWCGLCQRAAALWRDRERRCPACHRHQGRHDSRS